MSAHFSKFQLNTYSGAPYFSANIPGGYPLSLVLQKCRAFRRLPPNLRELSRLAKQWTLLRQGGPPDPEISRYYNDAGNELEPDTGRPLTDAEIDAQWIPDPSLGSFKVKDIPVPAGGFPDPQTWRPQDETDDVDARSADAGPSESQILSDIAGHGRPRTAAAYGVSAEQLAGIESDRGLAQLILQKRG